MSLVLATVFYTFYNMGSTCFNNNNNNNNNNNYNNNNNNNNNKNNSQFLDPANFDDMAAKNNRVFDGRIHVCMEMTELFIPNIQEF